MSSCAPGAHHESRFGQNNPRHGAARNGTSARVKGNSREKRVNHVCSLEQARAASDQTVRQGLRMQRWHAANRAYAARSMLPTERCNLVAAVCASLSLGASRGQEPVPWATRQPCPRHSMANPRDMHTAMCHVPRAHTHQGHDARTASCRGHHVRVSVCAAPHLGCRHHLQEAAPSCSTNPHINARSGATKIVSCVGATCMS